MATIRTRPGNPDAVVPYGYLIIDHDGQVDEEPISEWAVAALDEHFATLRRILGEVNAVAIYSHWALVPEMGLGFAINELTRILGLGHLWNIVGETPRLRELLGEAVTTDGAHHKQWFLEQLAESLGVFLPEHERGIAP